VCIKEVKVGKKDIITTGELMIKDRMDIGTYRQLVVKKRNMRKGKFTNERSIHEK
jgi:hypothetical protein